MQISELTNFAYWYFLLFIAIIGLCIGSFANVVILRGLSEESIIFPSSKCPKCNNKLKWYDNIPVLSFLLLRGKCRFCKEKISIQYPIIELLCSILFVFTYINYGLTFDTLFVCAILTLFVILSTTDLKEQVILTHHAYVLALLGVIYNFTHKEFLLPILGILTGFISMELIARLGQLIFKKRIFGEGDSYIGAGIGAIIGWKLFLSSLIVAILIQAFLILPIYLFNLFKSKQYTLIFSLISFLITALLTLIYGKYNIILNYTLIGFLTIFGLWSVKQIFKSIKQTGLQSIPFGPAMLISAFLFIFFIDYLSAFLF